MKQAVAGIVCVLTVVVVLAVVPDWTFWSRMLTIRDQSPVSYPGWIEPTASVAGDFHSPLPSLAPENLSLSESAIAELASYAEQLDSFALLVHHGGGIQLERYWRGMGPDDVTETYSMAKSCACALMVGIRCGGRFD